MVGGCAQLSLGGHQLSPQPIALWFQLPCLLKPRGEVAGAGRRKTLARKRFYQGTHFTLNHFQPSLCINGAGLSATLALFGTPKHSCNYHQEQKQEEQECLGQRETKHHAAAILSEVMRCDTCHSSAAGALPAKDVC
jgi:hypothetical protein